jgi:hypothetical protein
VDAAVLDQSREPDVVAGIGLRDEEVVDDEVDASRMSGVHRVLGVDEGADAAAPLSLPITWWTSVVLPDGRAERIGAESVASTRRLARSSSPST